MDFSLFKFDAHVLHHSYHMTTVWPKYLYWSRNIRARCASQWFSYFRPGWRHPRLSLWQLATRCWLGIQRILGLTQTRCIPLYLHLLRFSCRWFSSQVSQSTVQRPVHREFAAVSAHTFMLWIWIDLPLHTKTTLDQRYNDPCLGFSRKLEHGRQPVQCLRSRRKGYVHLLPHQKVRSAREGSGKIKN